MRRMEGESESRKRDSKDITDGDGQAGDTPPFLSFRVL
jgi:hypothetical protein